MAPLGARDPRGRHYGSTDPYGIKEDLQRLGIGLREISERVGGASLGHISNELSGDQQNARFLATVLTMIEERKATSPSR